MQAEPIVQIQDLKKSFPGKGRGPANVVHAVKGISFEVPKGEIFGLLGPNGAGKTTTMRMLCTLITPTSGSIRIAGFDLGTQADDIRNEIGYVSQKGGMQHETTGRENLILHARLFGMSRAEAEARVEEVMKDLGIGDFADRKTSTYSGGQRRIFDLAAGIIHKPKLLFLDEPSTGLDPGNRAHVWAQVKKLQVSGTTVFLTTHYLDEADALCNRVAIVDKGTIVALGSPAELKQKLAGDIISLGFGSEEALKAGKDTLKPLPFVRDTQEKDLSLHLFVERGDENLPVVIKALHERNITLGTISLSRPTLDDVFLKLTGRTMNESENNEK